MFKKAYVEILNICNLSCPFCHGTTRPPRIMSPEEFAEVTRRLRGYTDYVYLHVLGEPLSHPKLGEILKTASDAGMKVCITTNGTLLRQRAELLCGAGIHKLSVSLHSFEANDLDGLTGYLTDVWEVCAKLAERGTVCVLRLWNSGGADSLNGEITHFLLEKNGCEPTETRRGIKLRDGLYLENAAKFDWPDLSAPVRKVEFCYGLRDQIGVLSDGTVVPCCLDADGVIALGNIFTQELGDIINSPRARALYDGFSARNPSEELCLKCGYASRF